MRPLGPSIASLGGSVGFLFEGVRVPWLVMPVLISFWSVFSEDVTTIMD